MKIVVIGRAGSGKTAVAEEICKLTNLPLIEVSSIVQSLQKTSKENRGQINLNKDQREKEDPDWLWREVSRHILDYGKGLDRSCVISGIREPYLLHKIRELKEDMFIIGLEVSLFNRYSRLCHRDGFMSVKDFRKIDDGTREKHDYVGDNELGIDITLTGCDVILDGNKSFDEVKKSIAALLFDRKVLNVFRKM